MKIQRALILSFVLVAAADRPASADEVVTVTLRGGARITASLLRNNDQGVVLDLGHDVVTIEAALILDIQQPDQAQPSGHDDNGYFTTGQLDAAPVSELVRRFGDAVVIVKTPRGLGSGFIISDEGHLITNYHVIERSLNVSVTIFQRGPEGYEKRQFRRVKILAAQPLRDIALLQLDKEEIKDANVSHVVIADRESLRVGDVVFAIGNPLGLERSVTQGIVSSTTRTLGHLRFIQTDASINPGNSGGPMFNSRGEVVGIVCAGFVSFDGLAFGIPSSDLIDFLTHRDAFLFDPTQPQNGFTYLAPPFRAEKQRDRGKRLSRTSAANIKD